ncbi:SymE family type I addiction module toxin [Lonsdalea quercina]|uniref:SymE family type I addiction module toxin n=1 Tax=Lonsdalea quercina TaxID=71657 RepID=UPI003974DF9A
MADAHHKPGTPVTQAADTAKKEHCERHYTVGYAPNGGKKPPSPQLKLSGRWLEELGFNTGQPVIVTVERGKLVIEAEIRI